MKIIKYEEKEVMEMNRNEMIEQIYQTEKEKYTIATLILGLIIGLVIMGLIWTGTEQAIQDKLNQQKTNDTIQNK